MSQVVRSRPLWALAVVIAGLLMLTEDRDGLIAQSSAQVFEIVAKHSGQCLSVAGASLEDSAGAVQWSCVDQQNQQWTFSSAGDGSFYVIGRQSGKCVSVNGASVEDGAAVVQWSCVEARNQKWFLEPAGDGSYYLVALHSGKCLSIPSALRDEGVGTVQWSCIGVANQQWALQAATPGEDPQPGEDTSTAAIVRFLEQSTWGPTAALIEHVRKVGFEGFLNEQFDAPMSSYPSLPLYPTTRDTVACPNGSACQRDNYSMYPLQTRFFTNALYGEDQLRQRVAFALHQIVVVSGVEVTQPSWMAPYLQILDRNAFGNYRQLLFEITVNPAMGNYLDIAGNTRTRPNENYAREILQLFSIGTVQLNPDGTPRLDADGQTIPTYGQEEVNNFARVFTGWVRAPAPTTGVPNYIDPMVTNEGQHDTEAKILLNSAVLPRGRNTRQDTNDALDNIFNHDNVGPFISRQLIQHLVTSNPSPEYVARVAAVFNGNGGSLRGDLKAVVRSILLDAEARTTHAPASFGHLRHPALFIANVLRAFNAKSADGGSASDGYLNPQSVAMGMDVFRPGSVFSYFSPATGVPGGGGLRGPEFGLLSTSTALARANFVNTIVFNRINVSANAPLGTALDFTTLLPLASNSTALVDALNTLLLHGSMSAEMRTNVINAVGAVAGSNALRRVRTAVYLVLSSSQYQVER